MKSSNRKPYLHLSRREMKREKKGGKMRKKALSKTSNRAFSPFRWKKKKKKEQHFFKKVLVNTWISVPYHSWKLLLSTAKDGKLNFNFQPFSSIRCRNASLKSWAKRNELIFSLLQNTYTSTGIPFIENIYFYSTTYFAIISSII